MISIVVPSYGRPERLRACLAALTQQEGGPYETVVVDDGSPEPLAPICAEFGEWVVAVRQSNSGPAAARNTGVRKASGDFICFTDDDCLPEPGWAKALFAARDGDARKLIGGRVENGLPHNVFSEASQSISNFLYEWHRGEGAEGRFFTTNNMGCDRSRFLDLGGFDESFELPAGEDREFGLRWGRAVGPLLYAPNALVRHVHLLDFAGFWRQQSNYGRGAQQLRLHEQDNEESGKGRRFETPAFYAKLLLHPMTRTRFRPGRRLVLSALTFLSQLAVTRGYLDQVRAERRDVRKDP